MREISKLFDKQGNVQKENLKNNFQGSHKLPQAHKNCVMRMKETMSVLKIFLLEGSSL